MSQIRLLSAVAAMVLLTACQPAAPTTSATASSPPGVSATPTDAPTTVSPTPAAAAKVPQAKGAIDVSALDWASFASPSGRIRCSISSSEAGCDFPEGMDPAGIPDQDTFCDPDATLSSVVVTDVASFACMMDPYSWPETDSESASWWKKTGFAAVEVGESALAVLPYGKKLRAGRMVCSSERTGVVCGNTTTGSGFTIALAGVGFIEG